MKSLIICSLAIFGFSACVNAPQASQEIAYASVVAECGSRPAQARKDAIRHVRLQRWKACREDLIEQQS
ncbi:MAG: hypothetical protein AAF950_13410 [Pseudomonadota bacterium]